jgi:hypothetical protein
MKIFYGTSNNSIDVTDICLSKLANNNIITIPSGNTNRTRYFTDPLRADFVSRDFVEYET